VQNLLRAVVLHLWGIPHWWGMASCQVGNDRSDSRTTASKFNTSHPNVDLLYKSQPFTDCFNGKWKVGPLKSGELEKKGKEPLA